MPDERSQTTGWIDARERLPVDYLPVLCVLRMNDQGDYAKWQQVLYYDCGILLKDEESAASAVPFARTTRCRSATGNAISPRGIGMINDLRPTDDRTN
jgi:hypothetical protein